MSKHYSVCLPDYTAGADAYLDAAKEAAGYGSRLLLVGGKRALAAGRDKLTAALGADAEIVHTEVFTAIAPTRRRWRSRTWRGRTGRTSSAAWAGAGPSIP